MVIKVGVASKNFAHAPKQKNLSPNPAYTPEHHVHIYNLEAPSDIPPIKGMVA